MDLQAWRESRRETSRQRQQRSVERSIHSLQDYNLTCVELQSRQQTRGQEDSNATFQPPEWSTKITRRG